MRLGEASGAALAVPLMRMACQLHRKMATFESAGVSDGKREGESDHEGKIDSNGHSHSHSQIKSSCEGHDHGEG